MFVIVRPIDFKDKLRNFRVERITTILENMVPVPMEEKSRLVLHVVPIKAFDESAEVDLSILAREGQSLRPIRPTGGWSALRYNFDGLVTVSSGDEQARSYVQFFHNGCIEAVNASLFKKRSDRLAIPSVTFEEELRKFLAESLPFLQKLMVEPPLYVMLSLLRVKGYFMGLDRGCDYEIHCFDRDDLLVPESVVESFEVSIDQIMHPVFNRIWNACGVPASPYYDENGHWKGK